VTAYLSLLVAQARAWIKTIGQKTNNRTKTAGTSHLAGDKPSIAWRGGIGDGGDGVPPTDAAYFVPRDGFVTSSG